MLNGNGKNATRLQMLCLMAVLLAALLLRLFWITIIQNRDWTNAAADLSVKTIYTSAPRGQILDRKGRILADNAYTPSVQITRGNLTDQRLNRTIQDVTAMLEGNGDTLYDNFPIRLGGEGKFRYERGTNIDKFLKTYGLQNNTKAKTAFVALRKHFKIQSHLSHREARKILTVRNELATMGYKKYMPALVAKNISNQSVIALEENGKAYPGAEVFTQVSRTYPEKSTAAHLLGYMGKLSDKQKNTYVGKRGYRVTDFIGKEGLERTYETTLKGRDGEKKVQVDASGNLIRVLQERPAQKGRDITLTIDLKIQKTAERALKKALRTMRSGKTFTSEYGSYTMKKAPNAQTGAAVAVEVKTGKLLAMANAPAFDPNLFSQGISTKDWKALQSKNPRDPLAPAPLYNVATGSAVQPGSTFKMVTATAALQCGLDPEQRLYDDGYIQRGKKTFGCLAWNRNRMKHGYLNLQEALEVSCNYYFFDIATGRDFSKGAKLPYKKRISIEKIAEYAKQYGLGQTTGIEIPETAAGVPSIEKKRSQLQAALRNTLLAEAETWFQKAIQQDEKKLEASIKTITGWIGTSLSRNQVEKRLGKGLGVKKGKEAALADLCVYTYFNQADWTVSDALNLAIGQGENAYTPLQMARYVATLGNQGMKKSINAVDKIQNHGKMKQTVSTKVQVDRASYFRQILDGMTRVTTGSGGSLSGVFKNFPVTVAGKSGTAQRAGKINPPDETTYIRKHLSQIAPELAWSDVDKEMRRLMQERPKIYSSKHIAVRRAVINLTQGKVTEKALDRYKKDYDNFAWVVALAPAKNPKIAVAVMIVQGGAAANGGPIVKEILGEYFKQEKR